MKSKNKKDLIDENKEEVIEIQRRIRVKISDPDATDSSSDDEKQEKRPKIIVHEIIQEKVKIQSFSLNSKNPLDFYQFYGELPPYMVRKRECGKLAISAKSGNPSLMVDSQTSGKRNPLSFDQSSGKLPPMVRKRKSGKFATEIRDPFSKKRIWLGTFNTPEEASKVYQSKKLEFEERLERSKNVKVRKAISAIIELGSSSSRNSPLMVDSQKKHSSNKSADRLKKAKNAKGKKVISAKSELGSASSDPPLMVDEFDEPLKKAMKKAKNAKGKKCISAKSELGSASSDPPLMVDEFDEPLKKAMKKAKNAKGKKCISAKSELGSASSVPPLMMDEFDEPLKRAMKKAMNAKGKKGISAKSELGSASSDPPSMVDEFDEPLKKAINAKVEKDISAKSEVVSSSSDQVDAQTSDSSNGVGEKDQESDEELWMGQWIQISGDQEVKFSRKLGVPVVDNYGFLLGEFSKLDDLSISV